jgi:hypothetical protein
MTNEAIAIGALFIPLVLGLVFYIAYRVTDRRHPIKKH